MSKSKTGEISEKEGSKSLTGLRYKDLGLSHEIQIGNFSVTGRFPILVLAHLKDICENSGRPLFFRPGHAVKVFLDDITDAHLEDLGGEHPTLILDPSNKSHNEVAKEYQGSVSWFSIDKLPHPNYRGTSMKPNSNEILYSKDNRLETYQLLDCTRPSRELSAAFCAAREAGISESEVRLTLSSKLSTPKLRPINDQRTLE
jgi:hypothetical protein